MGIADELFRLGGVQGFNNHFHISIDILFKEKSILCV